MSLKDEIIDGLEEMETDLENPVFTFNGSNYACVPSVNEFKRDLDEGGFAITKMLTMSVRMLDENGQSIFSVLPVAQNIITYHGENFRIQSTHKHPTGSYLRVIAYSTTRGI
jgi:hypothetical protein